MCESQLRIGLLTEPAGHEVHNIPPASTQVGEKIIKTADTFHAVGEAPVWRWKNKVKRLTQDQYS